MLLVFGVLIFWLRRVIRGFGVRKQDAYFKVIFDAAGRNRKNWPEPIPVVPKLFLLADHLEKVGGPRRAKY